MGENTKRYVAEFFGTAVLVLIGGGAVAIGTTATGPTAVNVLGIAFAFGLAVTAMAYGIGPISGCHINPAVTLGMTSAGRLPAREVPGYIIGQLLGGVAGAAVLYVILSSKLAGYDLAASGLGQNGWGEGYLGGYGLLGALVTEFVATFIFVYVILAATNPTVNLQVAGLIIGLTLFAPPLPVHQRNRALGEPGPQRGAGCSGRRKSACAGLAFFGRALGGGCLRWMAVPRSRCEPDGSGSRLTASQSRQPRGPWRTVATGRNLKPFTEGDSPLARPGPMQGNASRRSGFIKALCCSAA